MKLSIHWIALLALACTHTGAGAAEGTVNDRQQIIREFVAQVPFLKKRFDGGSNATEHPVVLIITADSAFLQDLKFDDRTITLTPQAEVVAAQLASFASLSRLVVEGKHAVLSYDIPASDRTGEMRFTRKAGQWSKRSRNEIRSLASARAFYGKLYEGAVCRDGTEMAYRWNYLAGRQPAAYGGTCPGQEFPDVGVYRSQQGKAGK